MHPLTPRAILFATTTLALAGAWTLAPAQEGLQGIAHTPVAGNVHLLTGNGGNVAALVGPEGTVLVDDKFLNLAGDISAALDELDGEGDGQPRYLLNTHHHGDHTGSNPAFGERATIMAHDNVRARLLDPQRAMEPVGLPVITFAKGASLHVNGETIRLEHHPRAHTDGDTVVHFEGSGVVHMGDLFFNGMFPFVDRDSGGSLAGITLAVRELLSTLDEDVRIIPGHGELATRSDLANYLDMLEETQALVAEALEAGEDAEAMLAGGLLQDYEDWSWRFIDTRRYITGLVQELGAR